MHRNIMYEDTGNESCSDSDGRAPTTSSVVNTNRMQPNQRQQQNVRLVTNPSMIFDAHRELANFWPKQLRKIEGMDNDAIRDSHRNSILPLARIRRIMRIDDDVRSMMISAEVPALIARACEMFLEELTLRAWIHADDNKRKTLQRSDVALAISKNEMFDFLIDIVPREEASKSQIYHQHSTQQSSHRKQQFSQQQSYDDYSMSSDDQQVHQQIHTIDGQPIVLQMPNGTTETFNLASGSGNMVTLSDGGQLMQAQQIGEPITLDSGVAGGQPLQVIQMPTSDGQSSTTSHTSNTPIQIVLPNGQTAQLLTMNPTVSQ